MIESFFCFLFFFCFLPALSPDISRVPAWLHSRITIAAWWIVGTCKRGLQENLLQKPRSPRRTCCSARSRGRALHFPSPPQGHVCWDAMRCKSPRRPAGCKEAAYSGKGGNVYLRGGVSWYVNALSGLAIIRVYCHIPATVLYHYIFPWSYPPFSSE